MYCIRRVQACSLKSCRENQHTRCSSSPCKSSHTTPTHFFASPFCHPFLPRPKPPHLRPHAGTLAILVHRHHGSQKFGRGANAGGSSIEQTPTAALVERRRTRGKVHGQRGQGRRRGWFRESRFLQLFRDHPGRDDQIWGSIFLGGGVLVAGSCFGLAVEPERNVCATPSPLLSFRVHSTV